MARPLTLFALGIWLVAADGVSAQAPAAPPATAPRPPPAPRARAPGLAVATLLAQEGIAACLADGYKTSALVTDAAGGIVVLMTADGGAVRTPQIAASKVAVVIKYKVPSAEIAERIKTDAALDAETKADPAIGRVFGGAIPLAVGGEMVGAFSISGGPTPDKDEACVKAAMAKHGSTVR